MERRVRINHQSGHRDPLENAQLFRRRKFEASLGIDTVGLEVYSPRCTEVIYCRVANTPQPYTLFLFYFSRHGVDLSPHSLEPVRDLQGPAHLFPEQGVHALLCGSAGRITTPTRRRLPSISSVMTNFNVPATHALTFLTIERTHHKSYTSQKITPHASAVKTKLAFFRPTSSWFQLCHLGPHGASGYERSYSPFPIPYSSSLIAISTHDEVTPFTFNFPLLLHIIS